MKKVILILGVVLLTASITFAQRCMPCWKTNEVEFTQKGYHNGLEVDQLGAWNEAEINQRGWCNWAEIEQIHYGNKADIDQFGRDQVGKIFQNGLCNKAYINQGREWLWWIPGECLPCSEGNYAEIQQYWVGNYAKINQYAKNGYAKVIQIGKGFKKSYNKVRLTQEYGCIRLCCFWKYKGCDANGADIYQKGRCNEVDMIQKGNYNYVNISQMGYGNYVNGYQLGEGNYAKVTQKTAWGHSGM